MFDKNEKIKTFPELTDKLCPFGYKLDLDEEKAMLYKTEYHVTLNIPKITVKITVDKFFHVNLFVNLSPVPLPEPFLKGIDCHLKGKSMLENSPNYIRNFQETKNRKYVLNRPNYSANFLRYALFLPYTSTQAYKILSE